MAEKKLKGKLFYSKYSIGENILSDWKATRNDDNSFLIENSEGKSEKFLLGETVFNLGKLEQLDKNTLKIADNSLLLGSNLIKKHEARKLRGEKQYSILNEKGKKSFITIGKKDNFFGHISLDEYGNIKTDKGSIPVIKVQYELNLLIFREKDDKGLKSFFNYVEPNNKDGKPDGTRGIYFPPTGKGRPGQFCEIDKNKNKYSTALIWTTKNEKFVNVQMRTLEVAKKEAGIYNQMKDIENTSKELNINPSDVFGYDDLKSELNEIKKEGWNNLLFTVSSNPSLFRYHEKSRNSSLDDSFSP